MFKELFRKEFEEAFKTAYDKAYHKAFKEGIMARALKNKVRQLNPEEMKNLPIETNMYLKQIVVLEHEIFMIDLRKRYADIAEQKDLDRKVSERRKDQQDLWNLFVVTNNNDDVVDSNNKKKEKK